MTLFMASRSNYFRVRDEGAFLTWVETVPGVSAARSDEDDGLFALLEGNGEGWPDYRETEDEDLVYMDLTIELSRHLQPGEVAVLEQISAHKLYSLDAWAVAVNHEGVLLSLNLGRIYDRIEEAGWGKPTPAIG